VKSAELVIKAAKKEKEATAVVWFALRLPRALPAPSALLALSCEQLRRSSGGGGTAPGWFRPGGSDCCAAALAAPELAIRSLPPLLM